MSNAKRPMLIFLLLSVCAFLSGCPTGCGPEGRQVNEIVKLPSQERQETLARMPPEKQLEIYFYGQKYEPPLNFQYYIAPNWRSLLPVIKKHMVVETDEKKLADMIALLSAISITQCSLSERKDIVDLASQSLARVRRDPYKGWGAEGLKMLTHPVKQLPPCKD